MSQKKIERLMAEAEFGRKVLRLARKYLGEEKPPTKRQRVASEKPLQRHVRELHEKREAEGLDHQPGQVAVMGMFTCPRCKREIPADIRELHEENCAEAAGKAESG